MSAELETLPGEIDAATRHMLDLALMKARDIEGTYLADLELALNMIRQYRRSLQMVGAPDPNGTAATDLLKKYNMYGALNKPKSETDDQKNARMARELGQAMDLLSSVRKQNQLAPPPKQIAEQSAVAEEDEEILDAEVVE